MIDSKWLQVCDWLILRSHDLLLTRVFSSVTAILNSEKMSDEIMRFPSNSPHFILFFIYLFIFFFGGGGVGNWQRPRGVHKGGVQIPAVRQDGQKGQIPPPPAHPQTNGSLLRLGHISNY